MVEVYEGNMFFNKENELIYGKFLRKMVDNDVKLKTICYKEPCYIHKLLIAKLWMTYGKHTSAMTLKKIVHQKSCKYQLWNAREVNEHNPKK